MLAQSQSDFVRLDDLGIPGSNYYWENRVRLGFTEDELIRAGMSDNIVRVHRLISEPLLLAQHHFRTGGYELYIKEGYRPDALYDLIYQRKVETEGKEVADRLFNMDGRPHATGKSVDVTLLKDGEAIYFRKPEDGLEASFVHFYLGATDELGKEYQRRQDYLIKNMMLFGFRLGVKVEYWHFDYRPDVEPIY